MRCAFVLFVVFARLACASWNEFADLVVADVERTTGGVRVTYLGVNGYQLEAAGHALLVDPYFTRVPLAPVVVNAWIESDAAIVDAALAKLRPRADAVLVTHAHFDHMLDVPRVMERTGAQLVAGRTAMNLALACGRSRAECVPVKPGDERTIGPWKIRVFEAAHDRITIAPPFLGERDRPPSRPERATDWVLGEPLAFLIEAAGLRIYVDSGGLPDLLPENVGRVDLAIVSVALPDSRRRLAPMLRMLRPRYFLPSHQDDFFSPLARGFIFGKGSKFSQVQRIAAMEAAAGKLILLDYFRPWTLR